MVGWPRVPLSGRKWTGKVFCLKTWKLRGGGTKVEFWPQTFRPNYDEGDLWILQRYFGKLIFIPKSRFLEVSQILLMQMTHPNIHSMIIAYYTKNKSLYVTNNNMNRLPTTKLWRHEEVTQKYSCYDNCTHFSWGKIVPSPPPSRSTSSCNGP